MEPDDENNISDDFEPKANEEFKNEAEDRIDQNVQKALKAFDAEETIEGKLRQIYSAIIAIAVYK